MCHVQSYDSINFLYHNFSKKLLENTLKILKTL